MKLARHVASEIENELQFLRAEETGGARSNSGIAFSSGGAKMGKFSCVVSVAPSLTT
jgi:hypothetical protein